MLLGCKLRTQASTSHMAPLLPNPWLVHLGRCGLPVGMAIGGRHSRGLLGQPDQLAQDWGAVKWEERASPDSTDL